MFANSRSQRLCNETVFVVKSTTLTELSI